MNKKYFNIIKNITEQLSDEDAKYVNDKLDTRLKLNMEQLEESWNSLSSPEKRAILRELGLRD